VTKMQAMKQCPDCGGDRFFINRQKGEVICKTCSFVVDESVVDLGDDTRSFNMAELQAKSRTGIAYDPRVSDNLRTSVGTSSDFGRLSKRSRDTMRRISKKQNWVSSSLETNLKIAMSNLQILASYLKLTEVVEKEAAEIYRAALRKKLTQKRSIEHLLAGAVYIACRVHDTPKTLEEVSESSGIDKKTLAKTYKLIARELNIIMTPIDPIEFVGRFCNELKLSEKTRTKAIDLIHEVQLKHLISGKSPITVAATSLYLAGLMNGEKRTQKRVAEIAGSTETTLRNTIKNFEASLSLKKRIGDKLSCI